MKTIVLIISILIGASITNGSFSQTTTGKLYFFQCPASTAMKLGPGNSVFKDGKVICKLQNKRYSIQEIEPGKHVFSFQANGDVLEKEAEENSISINIEPGKIYYVELFTISSFYAASYFISEVPDGTFFRVTKKYKQDMDCK